MLSLDNTRLSFRLKLDRRVRLDVLSFLAPRSCDAHGDPAHDDRHRRHGTVLRRESEKLPLESRKLIIDSFPILF